MFGFEEKGKRADNVVFARIIYWADADNSDNMVKIITRLPNLNKCLVHQVMGGGCIYGFMKAACTYWLYRNVNLTVLLEYSKTDQGCIWSPPKILSSKSSLTPAKMLSVLLIKCHLSWGHLIQQEAVSSRPQMQPLCPSSLKAGSHYSCW